MQKIEIIKLGSGWYDFKNVPQGDVKIRALQCGTDKVALKRARKLNRGFEYEIREHDQTTPTVSEKQE